MKVHVRYLAQFRHAAGEATEIVELESPCSVSQCLTQLARRHGESLQVLLLQEGGTPHPAILLFLGDQQITDPALCLLREGDCLTLLSPMAGG